MIGIDPIIDTVNDKKIVNVLKTIKFGFVITFVYILGKQVAIPFPRPDIIGYFFLTTDFFVLYIISLTVALCEVQLIHIVYCCTMKTFIFNQECPVSHF